MTAISDAQEGGPAPSPPTARYRQALSAEWEVAPAPAAEAADPRALDRLGWLPARVPGTAAAALREAGQWTVGEDRDFDSEDWWFRTRFAAEAAREDEQLLLVFEGIATVAQIFLNGELLLESDSMFERHVVDVTERLLSTNDLCIRCVALGPLLQVSRRPRARWRTRLVSERNLRFFRTMLLGRAPGFAAEPAAVGPWKPICLERRRGLAVSGLRLRSRLEVGVGVVSVEGRLDELDAAPPTDRVTIELSGPTGRQAGDLELSPSGRSQTFRGELRVENAEPWWPHTHGAPALYEATLVLERGRARSILPAGRIGFRSLAAVGELERDGLRLELNGIPLFVRGAVWTPPDIALPSSPAATFRPVLEAAARAGMNMVRVPGTACYESDAFYDACDELGVLVWQDFMFANLDYPDRDPAFMEAVAREARQLLGRIGGRPSLAVLCGGSEVAQQSAMLGLDPSIAGGPLYEELIPAEIAAAGVEVPYVPSTPWGGDLPFRPDRGVSNYYGVGAYLRPLEDARRAEVKFAGECLAFSNVPEEEALEELTIPGIPVIHHPRWKGGVPRDVGAGWDFEDVRDHYLRVLFDLDPVALRTVDHDRYLELSRQVTGEVMSETLGEWRRGGSSCAGALVLWLHDLRAGAGWGLLDHRGAPKPAYHHVRRALAPVAVWSTDEGLGGVVAHIANDRAQGVEATLRVSMYRDLEVRVEEAERHLALSPHSTCAYNVEALLGRFVDASWAYRFGPPAQDLIVLSLEQRSDHGRRLLSQAFRFPAGRPTARLAAGELGLAATLAGDRVVVSARRFAYGVRLRVPGMAPDDDRFSVEPGGTREIPLRATGEPAGGVGYVSAVNLSGRIPVEVN